MQVQRLLPCLPHGRYVFFTGHYFTHDHAYIDVFLQGAESNFILFSLLLMAKINFLFALFAGTRLFVEGRNSIQCIKAVLHFELIID